MGSKIKLKKGRGMILPITIMILLGIIISSVLLSKYNTGMSKNVISISRKNQSMSYNTVGLSYAIDWLEKNKENLNSDQSIVDSDSNLLLSYYANGYFTWPSVGSPFANPNQNENMTVKTKSALFILPFSSLESSDKDKDSMGFISNIRIYRMCDYSNAAPGEEVSGVANRCLKDNLVTSTNTNSNNSAGYGGYEYTVNPNSDKIVYVIFVETSEELRQTPTPSFGKPGTLTETMISM